MSVSGVSGSVATSFQPLMPRQLFDSMCVGSLRRMIQQSGPRLASGSSGEPASGAVPPLPPAPPLPASPPLPEPPLPALEPPAPAVGAAPPTPPVPPGSPALPLCPPAPPSSGVVPPEPPPQLRRPLQVSTPPSLPVPIGAKSSFNICGHAVSPTLLVSDSATTNERDLRVDTRILNGTTATLQSKVPEQARLALSVCARRELQRTGSARGSSLTRAVTHLGAPPHETQGASPGSVQSSQWGTHRNDQRLGA